MMVFDILGHLEIIFMKSSNSAIHKTDFVWLIFLILSTTFDLNCLDTFGIF